MSRVTPTHSSGCRTWWISSAPISLVISSSKKSAPSGRSAIAPARAEAPTGLVRLGLGESRSPYFSFVARTFPQSHESLGNAGLPSSRTLLRRVAGWLGRADRRAADRRNHDLQRRRSLPRRNGNRFLPGTVVTRGEKTWHGGALGWTAWRKVSRCGDASPGVPL